jgi:hypothetical protein
MSNDPPESDGQTGERLIYACTAVDVDGVERQFLNWQFAEEWLEDRAWSRVMEREEENARQCARERELALLDHLRRKYGT